MPLRPQSRRPKPRRPRVHWSFDPRCASRGSCGGSLRRHVTRRRRSRGPLRSRKWSARQRAEGWALHFRPCRSRLSSPTDRAHRCRLGPGASLGTPPREPLSGVVRPQQCDQVRPERRALSPGPAHAKPGRPDHFGDRPGRPRQPARSDEKHLVLD